MTLEELVKWADAGNFVWRTLLQRLSDLGASASTLESFMQQLRDEKRHRMGEYVIDTFAKGIIGRIWELTSEFKNMDGVPTDPSYYGHPRYTHLSIEKSIYEEKPTQPEERCQYQLVHCPKNTELRALQRTRDGRHVECACNMELLSYVCRLQPEELCECYICTPRGTAKVSTHYEKIEVFGQENINDDSVVMNSGPKYFYLMRVYYPDSDC